MKTCEFTIIATVSITHMGPKSEQHTIIRSIIALGTIGIFSFQGIAITFASPSGCFVKEIQLQKAPQYSKT